MVVTSHFSKWQVILSVEESRLQRKIQLSFFLSLWVCLYLSSVESHSSAIPQAVLRLKHSIIHDLPERIGWIWVSNLWSVTRWNRSCLSSLSLPVPHAFVQCSTLLFWSDYHVPRGYLSSAAPFFLPSSLCSITCYKVPDTSHTIPPSVLLSHAQQKTLKECTKMWILAKNKILFILQKKWSS